MNAVDQLRLLERIERSLKDARLAASQLPNGRPLIAKITDAVMLADAWRCDQATELPEDFEPVCFGLSRAIDFAEEVL